MGFPKFNDTFIPILEVLSDGNTISGRELIKTVEARYYSSLPVEMLAQTTKSGVRLIENRIAWGKSYLKKGGYVHFPQRGFVQITDKGRHAAKESITLSAMQDDAINFYQPELNSKVSKDIETSSPQDLIDYGMELIESTVKTELLDKLKATDPFLFEKIVLILLNRMGYGDFVETSKSRDGGIDGIINEDHLGLEKIYIQSKRYVDSKVRETDIRNFIGAMSGDTTKGIFFTTSAFDEGAIKKAREAHHKIILIDGQKLVGLMHRFNVGVQVKTSYEVKAIDNDFFDIGDI
ncbi:restriction endonuclease [Candidatus Nomurabacteria bacterium]|nr:restriction endonuclease [Candidatus Nomurabacteria bacterium]